MSLTLIHPTSVSWTLKSWTLLFSVHPRTLIFAVSLWMIINVNVRPVWVANIKCLTYVNYRTFRKAWSRPNPLWWRAESAGFKESYPQLWGRLKLSWTLTCKCGKVASHFQTPTYLFISVPPSCVPSPSAPSSSPRAHQMSNIYLLSLQCCVLNKLQI